MSHVINFLEVLGGRPSHTRLRKDAKNSPYMSGQEFREDILVPAIKENDHVIIDMNGYNRYTRSFMHEIIGGLIFAERMDNDFVKNKITLKHDLLSEFIEQCYGFMNCNIEEYPLDDKWWI